jgi:hypothetical protein
MHIALIHDSCKRQTFFFLKEKQTKNWILYLECSLKKTKTKRKQTFPI